MLKSHSQYKAELGKRIVEARKLAGKLTQKQLAELVGLDVKTIGFYERGRGVPTPGTIAHIALFTHTNAHWLVTGQGHPAVGLDAALAGDSIDILVQRAVWEAKRDGENWVPKSRAALADVFFNSYAQGAKNPIDGTNYLFDVRSVKLEKDGYDGPGAEDGDHEIHGRREPGK
jgi:transcriptional regulator with XRE-family HTH domain